MQALIPVFAILGVAAGARLTLLPYAYLADPLPVYHQSQDTRIGVHAYSYAGGPSAKEEVRGLDGVTRGSYSYVDAHGILQSVFYVADEGGFRVAATNLPTDGDLPLETGKVLLTKNAHLQEYLKAVSAEEEKEKGHTMSRRKRSLEAPVDQDHLRAENPSSQEDQTDRASTDASSKISHESESELEPEKKADIGRANRDAAESIVAPLYSVLIPRLIGTSTSHQSRVDIHNNVRLKTAQPIETIGVLSEPAYETAILPSQVPLATSHQSRVQAHSNLRAEVPETPVKNAETIEIQPQIPAVATVKLQPLPIVTDYNENRIQLHKSLGLEGANPKNAVKIDAAQLAVVETPIAAVSAVPVVTKEALPVATAVSSQSKTQIHRDAKLEIVVPIASEPTVYVATSYAQPIATWPVLAPIAQSSQYRSQIYSNEKIDLLK